MSNQIKTVFGFAIIAVLLAIGVGCSVDSPSSPIQEPQPPFGSNPNVVSWNISLDANPSEIPGGGQSSVQLDVRAPDGRRPANGTLMQVSLNRGVFASTLTSVASVVLSNGQNTVAVLATSPAGADLLSGDIRVTGTLQGSSNSTRINVTDEALPVVAAFSYIVAGLEVGFNNDSTGASRYHWDFGDGSTSTAREPLHVYAEFGEYLVILTAMNNANEDVAFVTVDLGAAPPEICNDGVDNDLDGLIDLADPDCM